MDLKDFADHIQPMTCIISVEKYPDGSYGNIRIVTGNKAYIDANEAYAAIGASDRFNVSFVPDQPYERYLQKDLNFEEYVYRCAILGQPLHSYICPDKYNFWIHLVMLPLTSDKENIFYCTYTQELAAKADVTQMTNLPPDITASVLNTCIKLKGAENFQAAIDEVIQDVRVLCGASYCCILLSDFTHRKCSVLSEALSADSKLKSMRNYVDDDFFSIVETWQDTIAGSTCIIVKDKNGWNYIRDHNPIWYNSLVSASAENLVLFPLKAGGEVLGYIWVINFDVENSVQIKDTLELTTFFIASEISNYQLFKRLEIMSSIDLLTGVFNRNAMNNRVDKLSSGEEACSGKLSIVFVDLNGLKTMNDTEGHFAGDMLLKRAAVTLQRCFEGCDVYRAGGDEFMVIAKGAADNDIKKRITRLRAAAEQPDGVSLAIGTCSGDAKDIHIIMRTADENMYADKENFYRLNPDKKIR